MAYDAARGQVVLFGGDNGSNPVADTWVWDGSNWINKTPLDPAMSPSPRADHSMAFDAAQGQVVLFGGSALDGIQNDTWVWDGTVWTQRFPAHHPPPSWDLQFLAYDAARQEVVMFSCDEIDNDTWTWDGSDWTLKAPVHAPLGRTAFSIAYDAARQNTVIFGGATNGNDVSLDDTWTWDGTDWTQQFPINKPGIPRWTGAMAFDDASANTILFGGSGPSGTGIFGDTWSWDGTNWVLNPIDPDPQKNPPPRYGHAIAYDPAHQQIVMFGGKQKIPDEIFFGDTWVWGTSGNSVISKLGPVDVFAGLKNSDDQGTQFDIRAEVYVNNTTLITSGQALCVTGITRNPSNAKSVAVSLDTFMPFNFNSGDQLSLKILTRVGTNPNGSKCSGPGGSHNNAVGLRLYYDATTRASDVQASITQVPSDLFLHSNGTVCGNSASSGGTTSFLDGNSPTATSAKCQDSGSINFVHGNPWSTVGTWSMGLP